jgi:WD40 repeat protein
MLFSDDGKRLVTLGMEGNLVVWDAQGGVLWRVVQSDPDPAPTRQADKVCSLAWGAGGGELVSLRGTIARRWDAGSGRPLSVARLNVLSSDDYFHNWLTPDAKLATTNVTSSVRVWDPATGRILLSLWYMAGRNAWIAVSPQGHYRGSKDVENEIVYVVETDAGQETLTPGQFAENYRWKNEPNRAVLAAPSN